MHHMLNTFALPANKVTSLTINGAKVLHKKRVSIIGVFSNTFFISQILTNKSKLFPNQTGLEWVLFITNFQTPGSKYLRS